jgi:ubiquinone/menaquinone biosynthesis C-methylase UbiE
VDRLLDRGYRRLLVADISEAALRIAQERLGPRGGMVTWLATDARRLQLLEEVDVWHDRAVFHFLIDESDQDAYLDSLRKALRRGGHAILVTFGLEGPPRCSGLSVQRYDAASLSRRFGGDFALVRSLERRHTTPSGDEQPFTYAVLRRER